MRQVAVRVVRERLRPGVAADGVGVRQRRHPVARMEEGQVISSNTSGSIFRHFPR